MERGNNLDIKRLETRLDRYFAKLEKKLKDQPGIQILVRSEPLGISYRYPGEGAAKPYHIASIGKVFTSTLAFMLSERGQLNLEDNIGKYFPPGQLDNLFVFEGVDYQDLVSVNHLIGHTSGVADYFDDPVTHGPYFTEEIVVNSNTRWTPGMLLDFTREKQKAVGKPGALFHYSDTGYVLLGLILEKATGKPFHQSLKEEFFDPLAMNDSYLMFYGEPRNRPKMPIQKFWLDGTEASGFESASCDWAGGGIVSTTEDLLNFQIALREGRLLSTASLEKMILCPNKFKPGIYYGLGMMEIHFEDFFFLLKGFPRVTGHIGVLATHMFYDRRTKTHIIMNFGNTAHMEASFKALIEILKYIKD